jgi:hypothetical protein
LSYRIALERLLIHEPKRLLRARYWRAGIGVGCFIGTVCPEARTRDHSSPLESGMTSDEAKRAIMVNDAFEGTEEERYEYMVQWCRDQVAKEQPNAR